ncbi:MAG: tRNA (adenosine(37)-N6)-threonylcarbamoyltransferase complex dimerization subunit type 1 TsaB [Acidobacteria bacterium]|nr:tRNA (adenosine(37)-N6)-threonylcarbamoyltransferase complex dimerization subunit type 1 TsaB [Acidobacteriota bacterium]
MMSNEQSTHASFFDTDVATSAQRLVLAVDTSSPRASLALVRGASVLASLISSVNAPHSKTFFDQLAMLLRLGGCQLDEVDAFAAVTGPGSFTGLRVGLSAIKGLAHTTGKPAFGVNALDAWALSSGMAGRILIILEAGRNESYIGIRLITEGGGNISDEDQAMVKADEISEVQALQQFQAIHVETLGEDLVGASDKILAPAISSLPASRLPMFIVGDQVHRHEPLFRQLAAETGLSLMVSSRCNPGGADWQILARNWNLAEAIGLRTAERMVAGHKAELHPYYLRASDAELKWSTDGPKS